MIAGEAFDRSAADRWDQRRPPLGDPAADEDSPRLDAEEDVVDQHGERITAAGLKLYPMSFDRGGLNPLEEMRTLAEIGRIYRREKPGESRPA